jgi:hypothetical protein
MLLGWEEWDRELGEGSKPVSESLSLLEGMVE